MAREPAENSEAAQALVAAKKAFGKDGRKIALEAIVAKAFTKAQAVFLGDTDHSANEHFNRWLARPQTMQGLAASGVKVIYVETPKSEQMLYDATAQGLIDEKQFAHFNCSTAFFRGDNRLSEDFAIIRAAAKAGIRIICADPGNGMKALIRFRDAMNEVAGRKHTLQAYLNTENDIVDSIFRNKFAKAEKIKNPEKRHAEQKRLATAFNTVSRHFDTSMRVRDDDRSLARLILKDLGAQEKALVVYGAGHGHGKHGLRQALANYGVTTLKVDVFRDKLTLKSRFRSYTDGTMHANGAYVLSSGTLHSVAVPQVPKETCAKMSRITIS